MGEGDRTISMTTDGTPLPLVDVVTGRGFVTGKSGSGKSNTASVLAEELLTENVPMLIVDTDGEYYGLKERYELLHVGGDDHCDLQVTAQHAEKIAEVALKQRVPTILDVSGFVEPEESRRLVYEVVRSLFVAEKTEKTPFLLLVEEAHEFIPEQGGLDEVGEMLVRVAKRGRKRGLGICAISQRPASVDKDYITQCDWIVWHRLTWENDTAVVGKILGSEAAETVQTLDPGEAILLTDWDDERRRVTFRRKETFDAGATPGLDDTDRPELKGIDATLIAELREATGNACDDEATRAAADSQSAAPETSALSPDDAGNESTDTSGASAGASRGGSTEIDSESTATAGGTDRTHSRHSSRSDGIEWEVAELLAYLVRTVGRRANRLLRTIGETVLRGGRTIERTMLQRVSSPTEDEPVDASGVGGGSDPLETDSKRAPVTNEERRRFLGVVALAILLSVATIALLLLG